MTPLANPACFGCWGGYIFLHEEKGGPSHDTNLAPPSGHFKRWRHAVCVILMRVAKEVVGNWKGTMAFMEARCTVVRRPRLLSFTGACDAAYWTLGDNLNANFTPLGVTIPT